MKRTLFLAVMALLTVNVMANVRLSPLFGNGMVLQRNKPITIWGWADHGEKVTVKFKNQIKTTITNTDGKWHLILNSEPEGGPYQLTIKGKDQLVLSDVLVGEVWVCSGQSNMEFAVRSANNASREIREANYSEIRQFKVPNTISKQPRDGLTGGDWRPATPENVGDFTAVGYFYAKELYKQLKVPIGLINSTWGGTDIETWISRPALEGSDIFRSMTNALPPAADLDVVIKARKEQLLATIQKLQGGLPNDTALICKWREANFDDAKWPDMPIPAFWEGAVDGLDGTVWLRKTFNISKKNAGKLAELHLGIIDDEDVSYLNGVRIGGMKEGYNTQRVYPINAGVLKEGANTIAIRVQDNGGGGGVTGKPEDIQLLVGEDTIGLAGKWKFQIASLSQATNNNTDPNVFPSLLYNGMVSPLVGYAVKGVLWYQGENNAQRAVQYRTALPLLINDWRKSWKQADMPFYIIQISSWKASGGDSRLGSQWAELREAQAMAAKLPNTGLVVTLDVGETNDIHPKNKQEVGKRSAALALARSYGKALPYQGPSYKSMQVKDGKAVLTFADAEDGLWVKDKYGYIKGFELAGADERFYYAKATLDGNKVILENPKVTMPVAARYAWADDAGDANLYNKAGFPLVPFRTDDWKTVTANMRYTIK